MGLDQYAYAVTAHPKNTDFYYAWNDSSLYSMDEYNDNVTHIAQWRKHPYLQGWMERLFNAKADRLGFVGKVENGGMNPTINIEAYTISQDGESTDVPDELLAVINEATEGMKEDIVRLAESQPPMRVFNCQPLRLNISDLEQLETAVNREELPESGGFFWGDDSSEYYKEQDLEFIAAAREAISNGYQVYYDSWW